MRDIYIVRHGNTFDKGDVITRVGARTDLPLSYSGEVQAAQLGDFFKNTKFEQAYSSSLLRTQQTAQAILGAQANNAAIQTLEFLKEIDYGPDENLPEGDVVARLGREAIAAWDRDCILPQGWIADPDAIIESWKKFFAGVSQSHDRGPILIVTSNGIARFVLSAVSDPVETDLDKKLKTGAFGRVSISETGKTQILDWNMRPSF